MDNRSDELETIFVAYITRRDGVRIYASQYGLKAFPIRVRKERASGTANA